eukprot:4142554-Karenia_brevis.AAC.1
MEAERTTWVTQISPGRPGRWRAFSTLSAYLQVSMEAEKATGITQISLGRQRRWHGFSTLTAD